MALDDDFKSAAERVTQLSKRPPNDIMLQLYALYKQGNEGDVQVNVLDLPILKEGHLTVGTNSRENPQKTQSRNIFHL